MEVFLLQRKSVSVCLCACILMVCLPHNIHLGMDRDVNRCSKWTLCANLNPGSKIQMFALSIQMLHYKRRSVGQ